MINVDVRQEVLASPQDICALLLDHENLPRFFDAKIKLSRHENTGELLGGRGSIRDVNVLGIKFSEEIVSASLNHVCYAIIGDWPLKGHQGNIYLSVDASNKNKTFLQYTITCHGPKWLPDWLIELVLSQGIEKGLMKIAKYFSKK